MFQLNVRESLNYLTSEIWAARRNPHETSDLMINIDNNGVRQFLNYARNLSTGGFAPDAFSVLGSHVFLRPEFEIDDCLPKWYMTWFYNHSNTRNRLKDYRDVLFRDNESYDMYHDAYFRYTNRNSSSRWCMTIMEFVEYVSHNKLDITTPEQRISVAGTIPLKQPVMYELLEYSPKTIPMLMALETAHVDLADPMYVSWYESNDINVDFHELKPRRTRWGKFFRRLNSEYEFRFTDAQIDAVSMWAGQALRTPEYDIEVHDEGFLRIYREAYFGSCMYNSNSVKFYRKQNLDHSSTVNIMTIRDKFDRRLIGRALVWPNAIDPNGNVVTVLDRIYPSDNGPHIAAAIKYAKERDWVYKVEQRIDGRLSIDGEFRVDVKDVEYYPYMDTFAFTDGPHTSDGYFTLSNCNRYSYSMQNTDNSCPWDEESSPCSSCDVRYDNGDMTCIDDDILCPDCLRDSYTWCDRWSEWIPNDEAVYPDNAPDYCVSSRDNDLYYDEENDRHIFTGYIPTSYRAHHYSVVTHGDYEGGYVLDCDCHTIMADVDDVQVFASERTYLQYRSELNS